MPAGGLRTRFWIDACLECIRKDHTPEQSPGDQNGPFLSARVLGLALAALHDVKAKAANSSMLLGVSFNGDPATIDTSDESDLAAAAACHQVLRLRYPNLGILLDQAWLNWIDLFNYSTILSPAKLRASEDAGRQFGIKIEALGAADRDLRLFNAYTPSLSPYTHNVAPGDEAQGFAGGLWGQSNFLVASRVTTFPPPPGRVSATEVNPTKHYADDFKKVVVKGAADRSSNKPGHRLLEEEFIGIAWGYDGAMEIGTPPRLYLQVVLSILDGIEERSPLKLTSLQDLSIVAGVAVAMADAGIDAWYYKYAPTHMMWRPVLGIRNALPGNGVADPNWLPLGAPQTNSAKIFATPNFPAYPSGHATLGAAAFQLLRLFLVEKGIHAFTADGIDNVRFQLYSDEFNGRNKEPRSMRPRDVICKTYESLWEAIKDNSVSRVFLGVHWQFDGITKRNAANTEDAYGLPDHPRQLGHTGGVWLGAQLANQIAPKLGISPTTIAASGIT